MEMLRKEIRTLGQERDALRTLLSRREKEMHKVLREFKKMRQSLKEMQSTRDEKKIGGGNVSTEEKEKNTVAGDFDDDNNVAESPQVTNTTSKETPNECCGENDNKSLLDSSVSIPNSDSFDFDSLLDECAVGSSSSQIMDPSDDSDPEQIRKRAARMLVWANSATNRNERQEVPTTISLEAPGYQNDNAGAAKRLYRNAPNHVSKKGPLNGIKKFIQEQIVDDTYLDSDSYYSDDSDHDSEQVPESSRGESPIISSS